MMSTGLGFAERTVKYLTAEVRGLHAAAYILAVCALLSSLLALVRDRLLAHEFGASIALDVYYASFRIPDLIFVAMGALVSVYILIPELAKRSGVEQKNYVDTIVVGFSVFAICISAIAAIWTPSILATFFPQFVQGGHVDTLINLTRILLLQPIFLGLSNILAAITQLSHRYLIYAISPLLYNLGIILGITTFLPVWGLPGLALGVVLGAILHVGIQLPSAIADGYFLRVPRLHDTRALLRTFSVSLPRAAALSLSQVAFFGLTALAAMLPAGSIAVFMFGFNLQAVPLAIIGASYSVAAFPTLAQALSKGARGEFIEHVATAARYVFFWSIPATALIIVLRAHIVRVVLGSGAFDWTDTRLTAAAFALFSISLAFQGLTLLLVRGFYAANKTLLPFVIAIGTATGTVLLGYVSIQALGFESLRFAVEAFLRVEDLPGTNVLGLAFSYAIVTIIGAIILLGLFEYHFRGFIARIWRAVVESTIAGFGIGAAAYYYLAITSAIDVASTTVSLFIQGLSAGLCGLLVGAFIYYVLGSREYLEVVASAYTRLWRDTKKDEVTLATSAEEHV